MNIWSTKRMCYSAPMKANELLYRVTFLQNEQIYEIYSRSLSEESLIGFIEIDEIFFPESSSVIIDPTDEKLRSEFKNVKRCYIPMHNILRIDEVHQQGVATLKETASITNISHFPGVKKLASQEE